MKKAARILIILALIIIALFMCELAIWKIENNRLQKAGAFPEGMKEIPFHSGIKKYNYDLNTFAVKGGWGREPAGLNFTKKKPIVVFGCSYVYGYGLEDNQTMTYKLSNLTKRPVYNLAYTGWGLQHMLYQAKSPILYEKIKQPEYVIYLYNIEHLKRMYLYSYGPWNILNEEFDLRYKLKNNELIEIKNTNKLLNQMKRLYLFNELHHWFYSNFISKQKAYNLALEHVLETNREIQKKWKGTKLIVLCYDDKHFDLLLEKNGIKTLNIRNLVSDDKNLLNELENTSNPSAKLWDKLLPKIVNALKL